MNRLGFYAARLCRNDAALMRLSVTRHALLDGLRGRSVSLVGNARALAQTNQGDQIDAADCVIRINRAPMPDPVSHGTRTDWLALAVRLTDCDRARIAPDRILWMSHKRKRLDWRSARSRGFYLHPRGDYQALRERLNSPPTTGALMIDLLLQSGLTRLTLFGFDFFASQSLSGRRSADQVPHDFSAESDWVAKLVQQDQRLTICPPSQA